MESDVMKDSFSETARTPANGLVLGLFSGIDFHVKITLKLRIAHALNNLPVALVTIFLWVVFAPSASAQSEMRYFITRSGDKLMEGEKEYRFVSFNIPNLHLIEDNMPFEATNEWRFPDDFEINDAFSTIKQLGGRATRMYVISICRKEGPNPIPCHIKRPGEFNEEGFRALDRVLATANRLGLRVVIPLVDNWKWWGGIAEYASYRDQAASAFWTNADIINDFKQTIRFIINRRNTVTGVLYKDDKAILAWETGNELDCPYTWTKQIAAYIKSLDTNHLVWDGFYIGNHDIQSEALADPNIDIVSSHHYPGANRAPGVMAADIVKFYRQIAGRKAYIVGEFGFIPLPEVEAVLDSVIANGLSGAMIWSLRFHDRDGGFYWHSEGAGGNLYKAYHYPGFSTGKAYDETALFQLVRKKAYQISGLSAPGIAPPVAPILLPIKSCAAISWQGSVGASGYDVERSTKRVGPWIVVGPNVDDTTTPYRPLYADSQAEPDKTYYYRVRARNSAGTSEPSNVVGPVSVADYSIVDEFEDFSHAVAHDESLSIETKNARQYKEDIHRLKGSAGNWITYRFPQQLRSARILVFMEEAAKDFDFFVSADGSSFVKVDAKVDRFPTEVNPYGYKLPIQYEISNASAGNRFLKIVFETNAQISRVELHGK